jgi:16S rRNA (cytidine1402-2'-O)-methyltransferase
MNAVIGKLYLVPTPIGNLADITDRARQTLAEADLIACEDTRHSGHLLKHLDIKKPLLSYHDFNESRRAEHLASVLAAGKSVAVITDAGSPGICDPAFRLVRAAIDLGAQIVPLPGPSAIIPALTASGLPTDRFFFEGFLPHKSTARRNRLAELRALEHTLVFYESPHRAAKSLQDMFEVFGNRPACLAREISRKFEQFLRGSIEELIAQIGNRPLKGEIVLVVAGANFAKSNRISEGDTIVP